MKVHRNSKGFTLIELLIVIAIIGVLAAIAIPAYTGYTKRAKMGEVIHAMGAIKSSVAVYYSEAGATQDAADAGTIRTIYGVDVPIGRATFSYDAASRTITGDPVDALGVAGTITLTANPDFKGWNWGSPDGMDEAYIPKNS